MSDPRTGHHPDDEATIAKQVCDKAILQHDLNKAHACMREVKELLEPYAGFLLLDNNGNEGITRALALLDKVIGETHD